MNFDLDTIVIALFAAISIALLFTCRHFFEQRRSCAAIAIETPIYLEPFTKVVLEDKARNEEISAQSSLCLYRIFAILGVWASSCSIVVVLAKIASTGITPLLFIALLLLLASSIYSFIFMFLKTSVLEPQLELKRKRYCISCKTPFVKKDIKAIDFLHEAELVEYHAGLLKCSVNTEFCLNCSFPISRETLNLTVSSLMRDESTICPKCRNRTFTLNNISEPFPAQCLGEAGYKDFMQKCDYCGHQIEKQPRIRLSSLESAIKYEINHQSEYKSYGSNLVAIIHRMIQHDRSRENRFIESYPIIDTAQLRKNRTPSLREIKYLSTDDLKRAIELIDKCIKAREIEEQATADMAANAIDI
jgi:hypothetical protein